MRFARYSKGRARDFFGPVIAKCRQLRIHEPEYAAFFGNARDGVVATITHYIPSRDLALSCFSFRSVWPRLLTALPRMQFCKHDILAGTQAFASGARLLFVVICARVSFLPSP